MSEPVHVESDGAVRIVTIDRPHARNAVDGPTADALTRAFTEFEADPEAYVAILTGTGGTFCAGADLKAIGSGNGNRVEQDVSQPGPLGPTRMVFSKPVLAAVEGYCVAGGVELAMMCDLRVAARDAVFGLFERRWGVPLVDGGTIRLARMLGHSHALDLILTGRPVQGDEARAMGIANRLTEPGQALATALELAHQIAGFPQTCMRNDRTSSYAQWDLSFAEALAYETKLGLEVLRSGAAQAGAARFADGEGRRGTF